MKFLVLFVSVIATVILPHSDALKPSKCGGSLTKPCLSETDTRYDANFPKSIVEQESNWKQFEGLWKVVGKNFEDEAVPAQPKPYFPGNYEWGVPYAQSEYVTFSNFTLDGSRAVLTSYSLYGPAPESFCNQTFNPPFQNIIGSGVCGVNGIVLAVGQYGTSTHENRGDLEMFRVSYSALPGNSIVDLIPSGQLSWIDSSTLWGSNTVDGIFSQNNPFVFLDNNTALLNQNVIDLVRSVRQGAALARMIRMEESEWITAIKEAYIEHNIQEIDRLPVPFQTFTLDPASYPTEEEWCGGIGNDPTCTISPYQEPNAELKTGAIAGFVIFGLVVLFGLLYALHRHIIAEQERRIKERFIRGIARNISITPTAGALSHEKLVEEFQHIDKDKGGTIDKAGKLQANHK
jgi:hypothetical protein